MKRTLPALLGFLLLAAQAAQAQFNYTTNNGAITITGYTGPGGAVTIPATINGLPVISIGDGAFLDFYDPGILTSITIPASVTSVGARALAAGPSLTTITVDAQNLFYSSASGVLFDKGQTTLIQYPTGRSGNYTIPNGVTNIGDEAFGDCRSLTSITIPGSVTSIEDNTFDGCFSLTNAAIAAGVTSIGHSAFAYCFSLSSVSIPGSVTSMGGNAFFGCTSLTGITIPDSVTGIGDFAFGACTSLTSITIPDSVTSIGDNAFGGCTSLTNATIANGVTSIGSYAFDYCTSLTSITIPDSVTSIGDNAFVECTSLTAITVDAQNLVYSSVNGVLLNKSQTTLIQYPEGKLAATRFLTALPTSGSGRSVNASA